eukprot:1611287-Amphidinium_carterae.1
MPDAAACGRVELGSTETQTDAAAYGRVEFGSTETQRRSLLQQTALACAADSECSIGPSSLGQPTPWR